MTSINDARVSFGAGEVSDDLRWRSDLLSNRTGLDRCRNMIPRVQGGARRLPGTKLVALAKPGARRLIPFTFSRAESVMAVWSPAAVRFYAEGGAIQKDGADHELATPYQAADLDGLQATQSLNVQWLFSARAFKELRRIDTVSNHFELADAVLSRGPFRDENIDRAHTLQASGETGTVTLTSSKPLFEAGHVGATFSVIEADWSRTPQWQPDAVVSAGAVARYDGRVYRCASGGTTTGNPPRHEVGVQADGPLSGAVSWEYLHNGKGVARITTVTSTTVAQASVVSRLPASVVAAPTYIWREGAWSDHRGWPVCGVLTDRRLVAGGEAGSPHVLHFSAINGFDDFDDGALDDMAINRPLYDGQRNAVLWMAARGVLLVGTDGPEWVARATGEVKSITPAGLHTAPATNEGATPADAISTRDRLVFLSADGRRLFSFFYDFATDAYQSDDMSVMSEHLLAGGARRLAWMRSPEPLVWCLRNDGKLVSVTYDLKQKVTAWALHDLGGTVIDIAVKPAEDYAHDKLWLLVERAGGALCVETLELGFEHERPAAPGDAWMLHGAVLNEGAATNRVTGLTHLEGRQVTALVDGVEQPPVTVADGVAEFQQAGARILVGQPQTGHVRLLPLDLSEPGKSSLSLPRSVTGLTALLGPFVTAEARATALDLWEQINPLGASPNAAAPRWSEGAFDVGGSVAGGSPVEVLPELRFADAYPATLSGLVVGYDT